MRSLVSTVFVPLVVVLATLTPGRAAAADYFCDPAYQNCRIPLITLIENETVGIDVGFWFMQDARYAHALIRKWNEGVPVRVIFDSQAFNDFEYSNADIPVGMMADAGIPLRDKTGGSGIFHYKMMLFAGQGVVEFSGANRASSRRRRWPGRKRHRSLGTRRELVCDPAPFGFGEHGDAFVGIKGTGPRHRGARAPHAGACRGR